MIAVADLEAYLTETVIDAEAVPVVSGVDTDAMNLPGRMVALTSVPGGPMSHENRIDYPAFQVRVAGEQGDFDSAERLAGQIDLALLAVCTTTRVGSVFVKNINRSGGPPSLLLKDDANRYHFVCTYLVQAPSGL